MACGHTPIQPDSCFACKMAYWRVNGSPIAPIPEGWGGPTVREQVKATMDAAEANGYKDDLVYEGRAELV